MVATCKTSSDATDLVADVQPADLQTCMGRCNTVVEQSHQLNPGILSEFRVTAMPGEWPGNGWIKRYFADPACET